MAYRSAHVAMNLFEAEELAVVRSVGTTSRSHVALRADLPRGARVGYCPCCTSATHVAIPPA